MSYETEPYVLEQIEKWRALLDLALREPRMRDMREGYAQHLSRLQQQLQELRNSRRAS